MERLQRWMDKTDELFNNVASIALLVLMFWIFIDVTLRYIFHRPIPGTMEITGEYFMVIIVFLALSYTHKLGAHINIDLVSSKLPQRAQDIVKIVSNLLVIALLGYTFYVNFQLGIDNFQKDIRSTSTLNYPMAPAIWLLSLGFLLFCFRLILETITIIANLLNISPSAEDKTTISK